jgi:hypothetical protein
MEPKTNGEAADQPLAVEAGDDPVADLLTPARVAAAKAQAERGYWFALSRTGGRARVRRISAADRVQVGHLPFPQQQRVLNALARMTETATARRADGSVSVPQALRNMREQEEVVNAYCVAGFLQPRLIFREEERTSPDEIVVGDLDFTDRRQFFLWCETDNEAAAERAAPFLGQPPGGLPAGPAVAAAAPALRPDGPGGRGVEF